MAAISQQHKPYWSFQKSISVHLNFEQNEPGYNYALIKDRTFVAAVSWGANEIIQKKREDLNQKQLKTII